MSKYDELRGVEKMAVDWQAQRLHDQQATRKDGPGIYARENAKEHIQNIREDVASGPGVPELVRAFRLSFKPSNG